VIKKDMIITLTPNPSLDVSGTVSELIPNEKAYVSHEMRFPGGNGVNAARIAHRLGAEVIATGFLGGSAGKEFSELLGKEKIPHHFIEILGHTRSNVTISLEKSHEQTRLSFPGPKINKAEKESLLYFLQRSLPHLIVVGGSFPEGITPGFLSQLIKRFHETHTPVFVDVPGKILKEIIEARPVFIKPNLTEYQEMTGKKNVKKIKDVLKLARELSHLVPLQCISSVEGGALLVTPKHAWFGTIPKLKVQSTVGAGDSMVGAMAHVFVKGGNKITPSQCDKMLRTGLAASAATLSNKGLTMGTKASIRNFLPQIKITQLD
jgi:1-phosphofructokinase family hexose kinase